VALIEPIKKSINDVMICNLLWKLTFLVVYEFYKEIDLENNM
jgi:hypothetical protein